MKKIISFISIVIFVMALTTLTSFGVVGYADLTLALIMGK